MVNDDNNNNNNNKVKLFVLFLLKISIWSIFYLSQFGLYFEKFDLIMSFPLVLYRQC